MFEKEINNQNRFFRIKKNVFLKNCYKHFKERKTQETNDK